MEAPEVSVILPVFNRPRFLPAAIECVLQQTFGAWELLIVDDGSDDADTLAVLAAQSDPRVRVKRLAHTGSPAAARNAGVAEARGEYLAFLDSDDAWPLDKLERQLAAMRGSPECGWSYGAVERIDEHGAPITGAALAPARGEGTLLERLLRMEESVATPVVMMRRDLAESLGGFDSALRYGEDYDLWIRAALRGAPVVVDGTTALIRVYSREHDRVGAQRAWIRFFDKHVRLAADARTRGIAQNGKACSALNLAELLAGEPHGKPEARRVLSEHFAALLRRPRYWPALLRLLARLF